MTLPETKLLFAGKPAKRPRENGRGPGRPTREQSALRNQELLDAALDLFLEQGFDRTTIEAIVDKVGMARRTVYARYGDKITLFKAALQGAIDDWLVAADDLRAAETEDLEETLLAIARLMAANARTRSGMRLARIANAEAVRMPEIAGYLWERIAEVALDFLTDLFARRISPDTARDTAHAFLLLVVEGAFQATVWDKPSDAEFDRQIVFRTRLFLRGACAL